jgi:hypothetical protein
LLQVGRTLGAVIEDGELFAYGVTAFVSLVPIAFGSFMIVSGVRKARRAARLQSIGARVTALVIDNQQESRSEGRTRFIPVVSFRTATGSQVRATLEDAIGYRSHLVETPIEVVYDPEDPSRVATVGETQTARVVLAAAFGTVFIGFGVVALVLAGSMLAIFDAGGLFDFGP